MRHRKLPVPIGILASLLLCLPLAPAAELADEIESIVTSTKLGGATVAVSVRDVRSTDALVDRHAEQPLIPASNFKLFTTGAALHVLGPDFRFRTRLIHHEGRLVVLGDGDPAFGDPELLPMMELEGGGGLDVEAFLDLWVRAAVEAGLETVTEVVVDDRIFDRDFVHPGWPPDQLNRSYCAEVAGLSFHGNVLHFFPAPAGGRPDLSDVRPRIPWIPVRSRATVNRGQHDVSNAWIARPPDSNQFTVYGNIKSPYRRPLAVTFHDPPLFFARLLEDRLEAAGIEVGGAREAGEDDPVVVGPVIAPIVSTPISTVVTRCNRDSENLYAESLLKRIGYEVTRQPGSWTNGRAVLRQVVHQRLGRPGLLATLRVSDGSGLSRENRVSAALVTAWLNDLHADRRLAEIFTNSLAVPGGTGTMEKRFRDVDLGGALVQAKSGYINYVSCLSGYVTLPDGPCRSFSILVNGLKQPGTVGKAKRIQEQIVTAIAADLARSSAVTMGSD